MAGPSHHARLLFHGGDTMLGRAVQLTFPRQAPNEELIRDSTTAGTYLLAALHCPHNDPAALSSRDLQEIRHANADGSHLWGDYLTLELHPASDVRLLNLETAATTSTDNADVPHKGVNYHLHAQNLPLAFQHFSAVTFEGSRDETHRGKPEPSAYVISMTNNHALDYGRLALDTETLPALQTLPGAAHVVGLGSSILEAASTAQIPLRKHPNRHVDCVAVATVCSGAPPSWVVTAKRSGMVGFPPLTSSAAVQKALEATASVLHANDLRWPNREEMVALSIHWRPNWAYRDPEDVTAQRFRRQFAHRAVAKLGVDLVYGHSAHHVRGLELFQGRLIVYGAGDLVNDYEGFASPGEEAYCTLGALFLVELDVRDGSLAQLCLVPTFMHRLQLRRVRQRSFRRWDPRWMKMTEVKDGVGAMCEAVNLLSRLDAGAGAGEDEDGGVPVQLRVEDQWPDAPGGPVLVFTSP